MSLYGLNYISLNLKDQFLMNLILLMFLKLIQIYVFYLLYDVSRCKRLANCFSNIFEDIFTNNPSATYVILLLSQK